VKRVTLPQLKLYLSAAPQPRDIDMVILHHTWRPRASEYLGEYTWSAIRRYHMKQKGWSDIGYHVGIGPDGSIWLLRPIERSGAHCLGKNSHSVGVVMIGDFDVENPYDNGYATAIDVIAAVCHAYELDADAVYFHRDFANKTCPGTKIKREDVRRLVNSKLKTGSYYPGAVNIVVEHNGQVVGSCMGQLEQGTVVASVRILAELVGAEVKDEIPQSRTVRILI